MTDREKEVLLAQLRAEQNIGHTLKIMYKEALDSINEKIAALSARTDVENLQSIVYQLEYQKALKREISGILDVLNSKQFNSISEYLMTCYNDSFLGTLYDLQGQGIPLIFPIDQEEVVKAALHDTKLKKPLYDSLGEDIEKLKKSIQSNISRGFAQKLSYSDIAKNIERTMVGDYSKMKGGALGKAMTITRTESHRITNDAALNVQRKAKEKGADILKQWDATLDGRTRKSHRKLDGQIREINEPFEVNGHKAMAPGKFNRPEEDINCRCKLLTRARWALGENELETLKKRAEYFGLDKTKDFEDFKEKFINVSQDRKE